MEAGKLEVLPTHTPELFEKAVARAVALLQSGQVVGLPTETVYGLAANALNPDAVRLIFDIKGRPSHNPVIVHVAGLDMARECVASWPSLADRLARAFWPGPLTLVLPRGRMIPDLVTAGGKTVGIRWPSHPFMQAVIRACGFPLAAPSANPSNTLSPTTPDHVRKTLGDKLPLLVDGGASHVGIESTVLDLTVRPPKILRPGMIHQESLLAVTREIGLATGDPSGSTLRSPGLLSRHYAPRAKLRVLSWTDDEDLQGQVENLGMDPGRVHVIAHSHIPSDATYGRVSVIPHDAEAFARAIYAELHVCDDVGARWIVLEALPEGEAWTAIRDRLTRASR